MSEDESSEDDSDSYSFFNMLGYRPYRSNKITKQSSNTPLVASPKPSMRFGHISIEETTTTSKPSGFFFDVFKFLSYVPYVTSKPVSTTSFEDLIEPSSLAPSSLNSEETMMTTVGEPLDDESTTLQLDGLDLTTVSVHEHTDADLPNIYFLARQVSENNLEDIYDPVSSIDKTNTDYDRETSTAEEWVSTVMVISETSDDFPGEDLSRAQLTTLGSLSTVNTIYLDDRDISTVATTLDTVDVDFGSATDGVNWFETFYQARENNIDMQELPKTVSEFTEVDPTSSMWDTTVKPIYDPTTENQLEMTIDLSTEDFEDALTTLPGTLDFDTTMDDWFDTFYRAQENNIDTQNLPNTVSEFTEIDPTSSMWDTTVKPVYDPTTENQLEMTIDLSTEDFEDALTTLPGTLDFDTTIDDAQTSGASLYETYVAQEYNFDTEGSLNIVAGNNGTEHELNIDGSVTTATVINESTIKIESETSVDMAIVDFREEEGTSTVGKVDSDFTYMDGERFIGTHVLDTHYVVQEHQAETEDYESTIENEVESTNVLLTEDFEEVLTTLQGAMDFDTTMVDVQESSGAHLFETYVAQGNNLDAEESPYAVARNSSTVHESSTDGWITTDAIIYDSTLKIDLETSSDVLTEDGTSTLGRLDTDSALMDGESASGSNLEHNAETEGLHNTILSFYKGYTTSEDDIVDNGKATRYVKVGEEVTYRPDSLGEARLSKMYTLVKTQEP